ncbi:hypothetical protein F4775DRAFT_224869 [Biscogniauxia sp. FL1348]|nr:hypothetical protein F4775DRAFT_224869 [Biscogniauxia sp. FL1348]
MCLAYIYTYLQVRGRDIFERGKKIQKEEKGGNDFFPHKLIRELKGEKGQNDKNTNKKKPDLLKFWAYGIRDRDKKRGEAVRVYSILGCVWVSWAGIVERERGYIFGVSKCVCLLVCVFMFLFVLHRIN